MTFPELAAHFTAHPLLLRQALTHPSYSHEHPEEGPDYQRLELLGDAALQLCVTEHLMQLYPLADEGLLTRIRAALIREAALHAAALQLDLAQRLLLGKQLSRIDASDLAPAVLADALEALYGAAQLAGGISLARTLVHATLLRLHPDPACLLAVENPRGGLQEACARLQLPPPEYTLSSTSGPDHQRSFCVTCTVLGLPSVIGCGPSFKRAAAQAAELMLARLHSGAPAP